MIEESKVNRVKLYKLLNQCPKSVFDEQFNKGMSYPMVHDWRSYVPDEMINMWEELTPREKTIIYYLSEVQASHEEWE